MTVPKLSVVTETTQALPEPEAKPPSEPETEQTPPEPRLRVMGLIKIAGQPTPRAPLVQKVMAMLILNAGKAVSRPRLINELWEGEPPLSVETIVQTYIYKCRQFLRELAEETKFSLVVESHGTAYRLAADPYDVDALRFMQLVDRAVKQKGAGELRLAEEIVEEAMQLISGCGELLSTVKCGSELGLVLANFEECRRTATLFRFDIGLRLGRHETLLREMFAEWRAHPTREDIATLLMLALYRCGRGAEATDIFMETRRALMEDLGTEPGPLMRRMQARVLSDDDSLLLN